MRRKQRQFYMQYHKRIWFANNFKMWQLCKLLLKSKLVTLIVKLYIFFLFTRYKYIFNRTQHKNICFTSYSKRSVNTFLYLHRLQALRSIQNLEFPGFFLNIF